MLDADDLPDALLELVHPLATSWLSGPAATAEMQHPAASSLLVVGTYAQLRLHPIRSLLLSTYRERGRHLSLISGRDVPSVGWNVAKQYAVPDPAVTAVGLFTDTDRPQSIGEVLVFGDGPVQLGVLGVAGVDPAECQGEQTGQGAGGDVGTSAAPPAAWQTLAAMSTPGPGARPQLAEASRNTSPPARNSRLQPARSASRPAGTSSAANTTL